jgi:DNA modification methylase
MKDNKLNIIYVPTDQLRLSEYNPRKWSKEAIGHLKASIKKYGFVDPIIVNSAPKRRGIVIGGHFRLTIAKELKIADVPVVYLNIPDLEKEKELNIRLNKNTGEFDWDRLTDFSESFLSDIGFSSEDLDSIFAIEDTSEEFDLAKELAKLNIKKISVKNGDVYQLGNHRLMCGNSMNESDVTKLMSGKKADMCFTDPPYILDYLNTKYKGKESGFGLKRNRRYLGTDELPSDFTEKWMANVAKIAKPDFHIIVYENWKNIRTIWNAIEKHWKVKNMLVWHLPNRSQGFAAKYKFFSKHDIAMVGVSKNMEMNLKPETANLQNEYETALYAISGKPHWEGYGKGMKFCPTDFIEFNAADEKSSGQGVIFGTKPVEILIPYIKVLTKRGDLIIEPFGGSGSTLIAAEQMKRKCYIMEKSPVYTEIIKYRWQKLTGKTARKII